MDENFGRAMLKPSDVKKQALALLKELKMDRLAILISKSKKDTLVPFFSATIRKPTILFRVIITEWDSWQGKVSTYQLCTPKLVVHVINRRPISCCGV